MNRARRLWWGIYAAAAVLVVAALAWVSVLSLRLEESERDARASAAHQESMRLALWRMDSWMAPLLAREAGRPYYQYRSYYQQPEAYTKIFQVIDPGEVLNPSPLLEFRDELLPLHFELDTDGTARSPQVPLGNERDLAEARGVPGHEIEAKAVLLSSLRARLRPLLPDGRLETLLNCSVAVLSADAAEAVGLAAQAPEVQQRDKAQGKLDPQSQAEWLKRSQALGTNIAKLEPPKQRSVSAATATEVGALAPIWLAARSAEESPALVFLRTLDAGSRRTFQGFLVDWPRVRAALLEQVRDLLAEARLEPASVEEVNLEASGSRLATVPVALAAPLAAAPGAGGVSPVIAVLALAWIAVLTALVAAGVTLRSTIAFGEKRSRFASAVTHELRTPLTTFQLYADMLAEGMVSDEAKRKEYLLTMRSESTRLARLVENILSYARIEEGRASARRERISSGELLARVAPELASRAREAGFELRIDAGSASQIPLRTDPDCVGQILFNLIDNACKYAGDTGQRVIEVQLSSSAEGLELRVRDHGPGIPESVKRRIFAPFDRGAREPGDTLPGVGLGLALSRELAQQLGGALRLEPCRGPGACFQLLLPREA